MNRITVLIPTYNRKEELLDTLTALSIQTNRDFEVLVGDNCSNYSIEKEIIPLLPHEFVKQVRVYHHKYNVGGSYNMISLLYMCNTEYGWLLGDDDLVQKDAIEKITQKIEKYPDVNTFWFSIDEQLQTDNVMSDMQQLCNLLSQKDYRGDFIFCSNKVYKVKEIGSYFIKTVRHSYICFAQSIPFMESLIEGKRAVVVGNAILAKHRGFSGGEITWNVNYTATGMRTLMDYPTGLKWKEHCRFVKSIMFTPKFVLKNYLRAPEIPWNNDCYLKNIYTSCYRYCYPLAERTVYKVLFWIAGTNIGKNTLKKVLKK